MTQFDYSPVKPIRDSITNSLSPPTMAVSPIDLNRDGIVDQYNITLRVKKPLQNLALDQIHLVLAFDFVLNDIVKMKMQGLATINIQTLSGSKIGATRIKTDGKLLLKSPNALRSQANVIRNLDDNFFDTLQSSSMESFLKNYYTQRNE